MTNTRGCNSKKAPVATASETCHVLLNLEFIRNPYSVWMDQAEAWRKVKIQGIVQWLFHLSLFRSRWANSQPHSWHSDVTGGWDKTSVWNCKVYNLRQSSTTPLIILRILSVVLWNILHWVIRPASPREFTLEGGNNEFDLEPFGTHREPLKLNVVCWQNGNRLRVFPISLATEWTHLRDNLGLSEVGSGATQALNEIFWEDA